MHGGLFLVKEKLLILRGPPGSGKSIMVEVLSKEMNFELVPWIDNFMSTYKASSDGDFLDSSSYSQDQYTVPYRSQADDFNDFMRSTAYCPLQLVTTASTKTPEVA